MQRLPMVCWLVISLTIVAVTVAAAQTQLEQAIQAVRNWLGKPDALVVYVGKMDYSMLLTGPRNSFKFETPGYRVTVNLDTMKVTGWNRPSYAWVNKARTDLPMLSEEQIKNIALNYVQQHFTHYKEFSDWKITVWRSLEENMDGTKSAYRYHVDFEPYVTNKKGQRIPILTTLCGVDVNPYGQGEVIGFGYYHMPMTLTNLTPSFSEEEAKTVIEQAFLKLGAAQATAVMSSSEDLAFTIMPDGLVIGATQTSGLRLAYAFDYVKTVGAPGYEDDFGDAEHPANWWAAIDAHTGELLCVDAWSGIKEPSKKSSLKGSPKQKSSRKGQERSNSNEGHALQQWSIGAVVVVAIVVSCLFFLLVKRRWHVIER